ncbi:hypothetical protein RHGRI_002856 [Rhododendron griersonianum]|uniref:BHLH domain-containing protein n=1 Tax=Rhododendron griersonianum TaxID=479676 RepID=A0AAV6LQL5_9ERIC|nr:hypothetical protein RHGRI_002856 [Rhododendron griersonianum]
MGLEVLLLFQTAGPPIKRRAGLRRKQAGRGSYRDQMGTHLHQALRALCLNTDWKVLTWEDAYYDNHELYDPLENMCFTGMGDNLIDWYSRDPLGLEVAKMSCHVYSLGEGVIGKVAVTGKHMWIFADNCVTDSCSPFEHYDGWQTQFSAGIKTVVVVAVVPHGVVQLGSMNKIPEDLKLVNHIRDAFFALQDSQVGCTPCIIQCTMGPSSSSCLSNISTISSGSGNFHDCVSNIGIPVNKEKSQKTIIRSRTSSSITNLADFSFVQPSPGDLLKKTVEASNKDGGLELSTLGGHVSSNLLQASPEFYFSEQQKYQNDMQVQDVLENTIDFPTEVDILESLKTPFKFSTGCELYEVLGPAFRKQNSSCDWESEKTFTDKTIEMPDGMDCSSLLTAETGSEHLLEAVVANVVRSTSDDRSEKSLCSSPKSLLTSEKMPQPTCDKVTVSAVGYSYDQSFVEKDTLHSLGSESCGVSSSMGFSSRSHSAFSEQLNSAQEPAKGNKKRARPGENGRPRPRDRQLIQDRIKELRELVPNGSKCSIDLLLERTIKHMLFMQSITKHADKLSKCVESKLRDKGTSLGGLPGYDQGSSWAMEVGSHLKVCPIMVENINMNGQMLIEMLCEESGHFLEISEAIRSIGLAILKGVAEAFGKTTRMSFVVEHMNLFQLEHVTETKMGKPPLDARQAKSGHHLSKYYCKFLPPICVNKVSNFVKIAGAEQKHASDGCVVVTCADIATQDNGLAAMTNTEQKIKSSAEGRGFYVDPEDIWSFSCPYIS